MAKRCLWCGLTKPVEEFAGRWGQSKYCKICQPLWRKDDDRKRHADPVYLARARERRRERYALESAYAEERKQAAHEYRQEHPEWATSKKREWQQSHPERVRAAVARSRERHPERAFARTTLRNAVKRGLVIPQPCWCGQVKADAHHHKGYAPEYIFDVAWLCRKHHGEQHRKYPRKE